MVSFKPDVTIIGSAADAVVELTYQHRACRVTRRCRVAQSQHGTQTRRQVTVAGGGRGPCRVLWRGNPPVRGIIGETNIPPTWAPGAGNSTLIAFAAKVLGITPDAVSGPSAARLNDSRLLDTGRRGAPDDAARWSAHAGRVRSAGVVALTFCTTVTCSAVKGTRIGAAPPPSLTAQTRTARVWCKVDLFKKHRHEAQHGQRPETRPCLYHTKERSRTTPLWPLKLGPSIAPAAGASNCDPPRVRLPRASSSGFTHALRWA